MTDKTNQDNASAESQERTDTGPADIRVIMDVRENVDVGLMSTAELELAFDQLAAGTGLPRPIVDSFMEMELAASRRRVRAARPEITELLLRRIIADSIDDARMDARRRTNLDALNTEVIPILLPIGASVPETGPTHVRMDMRVATSAGLIDYIAAPGRTLNVIGLVINDRCSSPAAALLGTAGSEPTMRPFEAVLWKAPSAHRRLCTGFFNVAEVARACDGGVTTAKPRPPRVITFTSPQATHAALEAVFNDHAAAEAFYRSVDAAQILFAKLGAGLAWGAEAPSDDAMASKIAPDGTIDPELRAFAALFTYPPQVAYPPAPATPDELSPLLPLVKMLESIHYGRFVTTTGAAVAADMDLRGFWWVYQQAVLHGAESAEVHALLDNIRSRSAARAQQAASAAAALIERNKLTAWMTLIKQKLGAARVAEITTRLQLQPTLTVVADNVLKLLTPAERKPIELEAARREKYLKSVLDNKCPHVRAYRMFRRAVGDEQTRQRYGELAQYFKDAQRTASAMIVCNVCGYDVMCPHVADWTELDLAGAQYKEIKAKLSKYSGPVTKGASAARSSDDSTAEATRVIFCNTCGEVLVSLDAFDDLEAPPAGTTDEDLRNFMWGEIAGLIKYLKFSTVVSVPQFIAMVRDACYPFIFEIEKQILKSKTSSMDEIKAKKRLYVTIYAFAFIIHVAASKQGVSFRGLKGDKKTAVTMSPAEMIKHAIGLITTARNISIREIPNMSTDIIKQLLIESYKSVQGKPAAILSSDTPEEIIITLLLDPVYRYFYNINVAAGVSRRRRDADPATDMAAAAEEIMGAPIAALEKAPKDVFASARVPSLTKWHPEAFDKTKPFDPSAGPTNVSFNTALPGYLARSFLLFAEHVTSQLYLKPIYAEINITPAGATTKLTAEWEQHIERSNAAKRAEGELFKYRTMACSQTYLHLTAPTVEPPQQVSLARLYDEEGRPHQWDIYVIGADDATVTEAKHKDIAAATTAGKRFTGRLVDRKCSVCGLLWSALSTLSDDKILDSLRARRGVDNLFRFYENRCPEKGLHEMDKDTCKKCGLINVWIAQHSSAAALEYYKKYAATYARERDEMAPDLHGEAGTAVPIAAPAQYPEYDSWSANFNLVLDLAGKVKVNHRLLSALGAVERQEYSAVQAGTYIPSEVSDRGSTRAMIIDSYIKLVLTEYNQLRFLHRLTRPPPDLVALIDSSGFSKHRIAELETKLPDVYADYNNRRIYFAATKKPREIIDFSIQSFCEQLLRIWEDTNKETEALRHRFVEYIVKKILRNEELLSKPGYFNWSLLYGDATERRTSKDTDTNFSAEAASDRREATAAESDETGDTAAAMRADDFDMEDMNDDPDDPDAEQNQQRVGEEYGLD